MKLFRSIVLAVGLFYISGLSAVNYCANAAWGYGKNATGGGNATPVLVSSVSDLKSALNKGKNKVIIITKSLTFTSMMSVQDGQNVTLMAMPGVVLTSNQQDANTSGILFFKRFNNLVIRNIKFVGPGAYDCDGNDLLCFENVTNAWVDHCDFSDGCDGNFDNKGETDNVTISWCKFHYDKEPKAGGSGGADDHRFSNLLGASSSDKPSDGTYNVTWAYCWWGDGCRERMVRCRNASLHFLNCYWNSTVANYCIGPQNADAYVEGCYFDVSLSAQKIFYENYGGTNGVKYVNSYAKKGGLSDKTSRSVVKPTYSYTALSYSEAKEAVTNTGCGAGATLTVTTDGQVSSSCDGGSTPVDPGTDPGTDPEPVVTSDLTWNFSTSEFKDLGTISSTTTINGLTISASSDKSVTIAESGKEIDDHTFTHVLKTGGTGSATARSLKFDVSGNCTIDVYLISANSTANRTLNIFTGSYSGTPAATMPANTTASKQTYEYTGEATTIYMGSDNSGINIYAINVTYPESSGDDPDKPIEEEDDPINPDPEEGEVEAHNLTWNFSDSKFDGVVGSIAGTKEVDGLTMTGISGSAMTLEANDQDYVITEGDTIHFERRLKTGGTAKPTYRILSFDVKKDCTIDIYIMSGSSSSVRALNIWKQSVSDANKLTQLEVPTTLTKISYKYKGDAQTLVLGSDNSGINFYAINVAYKSGTGVESITDTTPQSIKLLNNGQVVIIRDGKTYTILGTRIK